MLRLENYLHNAARPQLPAVNIPTLASTGPQIDRAVVIETSKVCSRGIMRKEMASVLPSRKFFLSILQNILVSQTIVLLR